MARKKLSEMSVGELKETLSWYKDQIEFITFLINKKESNQ